jgi:hypothetical protein
VNRGCLAALGFAGGAAAAYLGCFIVYIVATEAFGLFDREGAWAMGVAFTIGPLVALVVGTAVALWLAKRRPTGPSQ